MSISDVLRVKGHHVVKVRTTDTVQAVVQKLSEERIGAVVVEDQWMRRRRHFLGTRFRQCRRRTWCSGAEFFGRETHERAGCDVPVERSGGNRDGGDDDGEDQALAGRR